MSPDAEVQILISAIDNMSVTLKKIEATLGQTQASVEKQTDATTKTFDKQMGSLLVLGDAANKVDNIFTSYQNLQLRLENASERVANAQDRLIKAQQNLREVTKKAGATAEDYADAQRQVEMASRSLQISQNNQARMNNMVIGTYINMSIQAISLSASLGTVKVAIMGLTVAVQGFIASIPVFGWVLIGATTAVGAFTWAIQENTSGLKDWSEEWSTSGAEVERVLNKIRDAQEGVASQFDYISKYSEDISEKDKGINMLKLAQLSDEEEQRRIINQYLEETGQTTRFNLESEIGRRNFLITQLKDEEKEREKMRLADEITKENEHKAWLERQAEIKKERDEEIAQVGELNVSISRVATNWDLALAAYARYHVATTGLPSKVVGAVVSAVKGKKDFISRPGQPAVNFSPDDTIIGMKNPEKLREKIVNPMEDYKMPRVEFSMDEAIREIGRMKGIEKKIVINITGPIYGTNPREIAKALSDELRKKVSI